MTTRFAFWVLALALAGGLLTGRSSADTAASDPLNSPGWSAVRERFFKGGELMFDDRVRVTAPKNAENPLDVPVTPLRAFPGLSFRFKVEQSTPTAPT